MIIRPSILLRLAPMLLAAGLAPSAFANHFVESGNERVPAKEYEAGTLVSHKRFLWSGSRVQQERSASGAEVLVTYTGSGGADFGAGSGGVPVKRHYLSDHLGSVRNVVDVDGVEIVSYDYDPYGVREKIFASTGAGGYEASPGYTGHFHHAASGVVLTLNRGYEPETGRWLSADPLGEAGGLNLYGYVGGDPVNFWDPDGQHPALKSMAASTAMLSAALAANSPGVAGAAAGAAMGLAEEAIAQAADAIGVAVATRGCPNMRDLVPGRDPDFTGAAA